MMISVMGCFNGSHLQISAFCVRPIIRLSNPFHQLAILTSQLKYTASDDTDFNQNEIPTATAETTATTTTKPASFLELEDPKTKCQIILLGCLHGSSSSATDVEHLLSEDTMSSAANGNNQITTAKADVVILELCASRFADLKREMEKNEKQKDHYLKEQSPPRLIRFAKLIAKTVEKRGLATGIATAILGGASGLQTALSGFEPGLEFKTAVELVEKMEDCDIVLADQTVEITLQRFGSLPSISVDMVREWMTNHAFEFEEAFGREAKALQTAVGGDEDFQPHQLSMQTFLTRHEDVQKDTTRLILFPLIITQFLVSFSLSLWNVLDGNGLFELPSWKALFMDPSVSLSLSNIGIWGPDLVVDLVMSAVVVAVGYVALALPVTRLILCERDDQLVEGIQAACEIASSKYSNNNNNTNGEGNDSDCTLRRSGRVVAVLGFLHVNGVAKQLLTADKECFNFTDEQI